MTSADSSSTSPATGGTETPPRRGFGVDVGGSGIKGGIVDLDTGELVGDRYKLLTPQPATPSAVAETIAAVVNEFGWTGPLGVTTPGYVTPSGPVQPNSLTTAAIVSATAEGVAGCGVSSL